MSEGKTFKIVGDDISDGYHTFGELYEHRCLLFIALMRYAADETCEAWAALAHHDGSTMPGWFIAGLELPTGTITYHLPAALWPLVEKDPAIVKMVRGKKWDGHTSADVLDRLRNL